ncbi:DUF2382 domain-containing protein [Oxalobacteraceae bacterium OM1]|nr:DUF2382 domain-containing protein [Oxalobacteraceae bacterium OM1]
MRVLVPVQLFAAEEKGAGYRLPFRFDGEGGRVVIPVFAEDVHVDKRTIDTGGLRISKHVTEEERVIDEALFRDALDVQRVRVDRIVSEDDAPRARQEGDTYIVPVLEEVLVVQKQLLLKEEVRITRRREEVHAPQRVSLRSEHVSVERADDKPAPQSSR